MKVVVTGAGGFIGRRVVRELVSAGHEVTASDRPGVRLEARGVRPFAAELADPAATRALVAGHEAVVHAAGLFDLGASREALDESNVRATEQVVDACEAAGATRLVHLSTVAVYGRPRAHPCPESEPPRPRHAYEETKARGEAAVRRAMARLRVTILRPTLVYGPESRYGVGMFAAGLCLALASGRSSLPGLDRGPLVHAVHVDDVARAVAFCLAEDETMGQTLNVADDVPMPFGSMLELLARQLDLRIDRTVPWRASWARLAYAAVDRLVSDERLARINAKLERRWTRLADQLGFEPLLVPRLDRDWLAYAGADHAYDTRKLRRLGFSPKHPDFARGIPDTVRWYLDRRWLPHPAEVRAFAEQSRADGAVAPRAAS